MSFFGLASDHSGERAWRWLAATAYSTPAQKTALLLTGQVEAVEPRLREADG